jgi:hypothetical protein
MQRGFTPPLVSLLSYTCLSLHSFPTGRTVADAFAAVRGNGVPTERQLRIVDRITLAHRMWAAVMYSTASDEEYALVDGCEDMASHECLQAYLTH